MCGDLCYLTEADDINVCITRCSYARIIRFFGLIADVSDMKYKFNIIQFTSQSEPLLHDLAVESEESEASRTITSGDGQYGVDINFAFNSDESGDVTDPVAARH